MSRLILLRAAVPWISSGLLAIGWIALRYGGGDDLESRAMGQRIGVQVWRRANAYFRGAR